jgi:type IV secretory pathway VirB3-like protein
MILPVNSLKFEISCHSYSCMTEPVVVGIVYSLCCFNGLYAGFIFLFVVSFSVLFLRTETFKEDPS